jgi:Domain of unknown function (DUF4277)
MTYGRCPERKSRAARLMSIYIDVSLLSDFSPLDGLPRPTTMTAEVAVDRPPDPMPAGASRDNPVGQTPNRTSDESTSPQQPGEIARAAGRTLTSCRVAALPILDRILRRLRLEEFLRGHLPPEDRRARVSTATGLLVLVKNLLISREPLYGVGEWAARHAPELLGLAPEQLPSLNDDRVGRCLDRLFDADIPSLTLAAVAHAVREFGVELDELHNDSTTVTFHGDYEAADRAGAAPAGRHLGAQQGPPPRPEAVALHPHSHPRRCRAGAVPG